VGAVVTGVAGGYLTKPLDISQCVNTSEAASFDFEVFMSSDDRGAVDDFYEISYMWYSLFGIMITVIVAIVVSAITGN
jgi:hypothetical protein